MLKSFLTASFIVTIAINQSAMSEEKPSTAAEAPAAAADSKNESDTKNPPAAEPVIKSSQKKTDSKKDAKTTEPHVHKKEKRQGHAHNHGSARLNVVVTGKNITISGDFPLMDLLGFERVPQSEDEKSSLSNIFHSFRQGSIIQPAASGCTMSKMDAKVEPPFTGASNRGQTSSASVKKETHHGIDFELAWQCPEEVSKLKLGVFDSYAGVNRINIQFINQSKQGNIDLKRSDKKTEIELK